MAMILVVDDEAPLREVIAVVLEDEGHEMLQARNGRDALTLPDQTVPELVAADVMMPFVRSIALLEAMQDWAELAAIPVILITAAERERALSAGAVAMLDKPFNLDRREALVRRWLPEATAS
jgi:two-component system, sensor histidine kinase and response regulator